MVGKKISQHKLKMPTSIANWHYKGCTYLNFEQISEERNSTQKQDMISYCI